MASSTSSWVDVDPIPSVALGRRRTISASPRDGLDATALGIPVAGSGEVPGALGLDRDQLAAAGFLGAVGTTLVRVDRSGPVVIATGTGEAGALDAAALRHAAAAFARAAAGHEHLAMQLPAGGGLRAEDAAAAIVEGALLARYRYDVLRSAPTATPVTSLVVVVPDEADLAAATRGAARGRAFADATMLARDLANTPHNHLSATRLGELATALGRVGGLEVEVVEEAGLIEQGIGGLLGVNAGSAEPPVMIVLRYRPEPGAERGARLAIVGKGIMYDSGGIALKPADAVHAQMKNDMSGAAAILAAMLQLRTLGCGAEVTGYLMCTDSMPSGTALALGDVITMRGGTTVEVVNTDAEGRLVMADALVLAREAGNDAIVDIATLTGAMMRALGREVAGVIGNDDALVEAVRAAGRATDEPAWPLPLHRPYRSQLDSTVADLKNLGYGDGGAITAALFLAEFARDTPWAHLDIAGTAQGEADRSWGTAGCTGFGARLLLRLALDFQAGSGA
jgi:leucyl aminopeptidase